MSQSVPFPFGPGGAQPAQHQSMSVVPQNMQPPQQPATGQASTQAHQAPFQRNGLQSAAALSSLPELQGVSIEQLSLIARLLQSGALTLPPNPVLPVQAAPVAPAPVPSSDLPPTTQSTATVPRLRDDIDMDREEGELEEGEEANNVRERAFLRPPPTGPRKRSVSPGVANREGHLDIRAGSQERRASGEQTNSRKPSAQGAEVWANGQTSRKLETGRDEASKAFVMTMYKAGYDFRQLAKEVSNPRPLRRMFEQLGLPTEPIAVAAPSTNGVSPARATLNEASETSQQEAPTGPRKVPTAKRPAPALPAAKDRSEYLARLQALKNKKPETSAMPSISKPADQTPVSIQGESEQKPVGTVPSSVINKRSVPAMTPDKNELLKRKLEALRAQQAAKAHSTQPSSDATTISSPLTVPAAQSSREDAPPASNSDLGTGIAGVATEARQATRPAIPMPPAPQHVAQPLPAPVQTTFSPAPPTPGRPFSSLPGLFMLGVPAQPASTFAQQTPPVTASESTTAASSAQEAVAGPAASSLALNDSRKRPVASDFDNDVPAVDAQSAKRPLFGQSRSNSESERLVIVASDDEDDSEDEMDLDESRDQPKLTASVQTKPFRDVGPLRDFPPNPVISAQQSAPGTPPVATPGSSAEYARKLAEIEEIKRKIAEREARAKLNPKNGKSVVKDASAPASGVNTPVPQAAPASVSAPTVNGNRQAALQSSGNVKLSSAGLDAAMLARQQEKEKLRRRLLELEQDEARTASSSIGPAKSGAPPGVSFASQPTSVETAEPVQEPSKVQVAPVAVDESMDISEDEEGEVSDEATQSFTPPMSGVVNDGKIGSQATEASGTTLSQELSQPGDIAPEAQHTVHPPTAEEDEEAEMDEDSSEDEDEDEDEDGNGDDDLHDSHLDQGSAQTVSVSHEDRPHLQEENSNEPSSNSATDSEAINPEPVPVAMGQPDLEDDEYEPLATVQDASITRAKNMADDDLAPELQPLDEQQMVVSDQDTKAQTYFKPYESVLSRFKDYRYHPDYLDTVSGGFKSLTYSHNIDATKPLCPFEAAGGRCNDRTCENQHFSTMGLNDNDLLKLLGTHNTPVHTPEDEKRWREGLGAVVRQLRTTNLGRDASAIAARIAEFRREFIGDPTKTLNLG